MFYVAYRILLVMVCVLKFYFVDFNGMFTFLQHGIWKCMCFAKSGKNIIFQNKTLVVMFYRYNKTFWYQFCSFKYFLKIENSEGSLASLCDEFCIGFCVTQYETGLLLELPHVICSVILMHLLIAGTIPILSNPTDARLKQSGFCLLCQIFLFTFLHFPLSSWNYFVRSALCP